MTLLNYLSGPEQDKFAAWQACSPVQGQGLLPSDYRVDADGNIIRWADYGSQSQYGWEIDHVLPSALGGANHASNYRALHWKANRSRGGVLGNALKPRGLFGGMTR